MLYIVGTPIGNLEDLSPRAQRILKEVSLIAAEDTRAARTLLSRYGINTRAISYFAGNEAERTTKLIEQLKEGTNIALISEAGMPGISDPGSVLIKQCIAEQIPIDVIPGPSAPLAALLLSGISSDIFQFVGFLPRKGSARRDRLRDIAEYPYTTIFFESPNRVVDTLNDLIAVPAIGDRHAAIVREITKLFQETKRNSLSKLIEWATENPPRGEVTIVLSGPEAHPTRKSATTIDLAELVKTHILAGKRPKEIAQELGNHYGKREVYQLALELRDALGSDPA